MKLFKLLLITCIMSLQTFAKNYKVAWSHYTGWEPWGYIQDSGIMKKYADAQGIKVDIVLVNDYIESINQYTAGTFDACTMTNMDALTIPAVGGVDSEAVIVGDFSNGNDAVLSRSSKIQSIKDVEQQEVYLAEFSVSEYLLNRCLDKAGVKRAKTVNMSESDIVAAFEANPRAVVTTWNPHVMNLKKVKGSKVLCDSSEIQGEIVDLMVVKTNADEKLKKALVGAWYEAMKLMKSGDEKMMEFMAKQAGSTVEDFKAQLKTTEMFYNNTDAVNFVASGDVQKTMENVRDFSHAKGMMKTKDVVGIQFDDGKVIGNANNVKLRFTSKYMKELK